MVKKGLLAFLLLACVSIVVTTDATCGEYGVGEVSECTEAFPSLLHIDTVADNTKLETMHKRQVLIPDSNFSCNGFITKWIFGAKWEGKMPAHTELQIWRRNSTTENTYTKVNGTIIMVNTKNNSKVYEYMLEAPLAFQEGDILGYFQPENKKSELDLYLEKSGRITTYHQMVMGNVNDAEVFTINTNMMDTRYPLIAVRTDPPDCGCGFMSVERVYALLRSTGMKKDFNNRQMIFPDIMFSCSGEVVKWIVAEKWDHNKMNPPELQIWRLSEGSNNNYMKLNSTIISPDSEEDDEVYEYRVDSPLPFQPGDILGVLQPDGSKLKVRYEQGGGSLYYYSVAGENNEVFDISGTSISMKTDLPLVTVEIVQYTSLRVLLPSSTTVLPSIYLTISLPNDGGDLIPTTATEMRSTMEITTTNEDTQPTSTTVDPSRTTTYTNLQPSSFTSNEPITTTNEDTQPTSTTVDPSRTTTYTNLQPSPFISNEPITTTNEDTQPTSTTVDPSRATTYTNLQPSPFTSNEPLTVPMVTDDNQSQEPGGGLNSGAVIGIASSLIIILLLVAISVTVIMFLTCKKRQHKEEENNETDGRAAKYTKDTDTIEVYPNDNNLYAIPDTAQHYETPILQKLEANEEWGIYVPTTHQRAQYQEVEDIYSYAELKPVVRNGGGSGGEETSFFTESAIYWVPASSPTELYEQLSKYRFREIQRKQIETKAHLGSGQFGTVNKGVWHSPRSQQDVAIKLLQDGAPEQDRVKFLQEAAIMGQFSHPNIISLLGVVTLGEPVMIIMELMENGDLRKNLLNMRPIPGEMAVHSLYQQLLDFCHQISAGMTYLSDKAFVHRDIAARNILLSGKTCKIADFGMARDLEESTYYRSHGGQIPVKWTAPEALHYKKYSTASDVWSFGCLMYEIWSLGHKPFEGYTNSQVVHMVPTGWRLPPPPGCPREMYRLMTCCWHPEAASRPQFCHLLQTLSRSEHELLFIPEEVTRGHPQASILGAPLEVTKETYTDLQNTYT